MGDAKAGPVRLSYNPQLRVELHGATVTSDAGLLLPRELDERLGLSTLIERHLTDPRTGRNSQFPLPDLFRQSIHSRLAGYEDTNDAERLAEDPTFRMLASRERREASVALTSTLHWLGRRGNGRWAAFRTAEWASGTSRPPFRNSRNENLGPNRKSRFSPMAREPGAGSDCRHSRSGMCGSPPRKPVGLKTVGRPMPRRGSPGEIDRE